MKCPKCGTELVEEYHLPEEFEIDIETGRVRDNLPEPEWCPACGYCVMEAV